MPELPDLKVIREFLAGRIIDVPIASAQVRRPPLMQSTLS